MLRASSFAAAVAIGCVAAAPASAFVSGDVHRAPDDCLASSCDLLEVASGDRSGAAPLAQAARSPGGLASADDLALLSQLDADAVALSEADTPVGPAPAVAGLEASERAVLGLGLLLGSWWLRPRFARAQARARRFPRLPRSAG